MKKIWRFLASMRFALILLGVLAAACAAGSFIPQGQTLEWYADAYSERTAACIVALGLDDVYHSAPFVLLALFLCGNLLLCSLTRLPQIVRRTREAADPDRVLSGEPTVSRAGVADPQAVFSALRMPKPMRVEREGGEALLSVKNRAGFWGAWVCHLGILLLILGFGLGQMTHREWTVYGVPGQSRSVGDTGCALAIDDFRVDLRPDDTVEQYTAAVTLRDGATGASESAEISVNHPASLFGYTLYQNSTGWAARLTVLRGGETVQEEILCAGEYLRVADLPDLAVVFNAFYPDYVLVEGSGPATASAKLNNPAYLYSVYYMDALVGMNVLLPDETIKVDDYSFRFSDPQNYTVIQIKRDRFTPLALAGGLLTALALALALYVQPAAVWAVREPDGKWTVRGRSPKGGVLFAERFAAAAPSEKQP